MTYEYPEEVVLAHREAAIRAKQENMALQEMLAHLLDQIGSPIYISKKDLASGRFAGKGIDISEDTKNNRFVLSLVDDE